MLGPSLPLTPIPKVRRWQAIFVIPINIVVVHEDQKHQEEDSKTSGNDTSNESGSEISGITDGKCLASYFGSFICEF